MVRVTTTHLQQLSPGELVPSRASLPAGCRIELAVDPSPEFSRFLYRGVGSGWNWTDRLSLTRGEWEAVLRAPGSETWVLSVGGAPAGYAELAAADRDGGTDVEIVYFGLFPGHHGRGLGGALLTEALRRAWDLDSRWEGLGPVRRVWLHTCSLDGPAALGNYLARGLAVFRTEEEDVEPGDGAAGLWPEPAGATPPGSS